MRIPFQIPEDTTALVIFLAHHDTFTLDSDTLARFLESYGGRFASVAAFLAEDSAHGGEVVVEGVDFWTAEHGGDTFIFLNV
jgi:hypothetical protein